jgi:hypothetical protein
VFVHTVGRENIQHFDKEQSSETSPKMSSVEPVAAAAPSDTKKKISQFEKASKVKVLTDEELRKKAKFNSKFSKFENACAASNGAPPAPGRSGMERKDSTDVLSKAKYFVDVAGTNAKEQGRRLRDSSNYTCLLVLT